MKVTMTRYAVFGSGRGLVAWLMLALCALAGQASAALSVSPSVVALSAGTYSTTKISGATGQIQAESKNTAVATVTLSNVTSSSATLNIFGRGAGSTTINVRDTLRSINVSVTVVASTAMAVSPTSLSVVAGSNAILTASQVSGTVSARSSSTGVASVSVSANVVTVKAIATGSALVSVTDSKTTVTVPVTVTAAGTTTGSAKFALLAWNDLGMHCMDGKDYSVFSILPPYNNLHAQLVNAGTGQKVTSGVTLTYEAVRDPSGSINTSSAGKTNFWSWSNKLYGGSPAPNVGLTGFSTLSLTPKLMTLDAANGWFEASGIPITPYDDNGNKNFYPTVKVTAKDSTGKVLATTTTVLPVSDEITCAACHASRPIGETGTPRTAAKPAGGWINDTVTPENDWKKNILRLHDEKQAGNTAYQAALISKGLSAGLLNSALNGTPVLCAACHASNALPGTGVSGISAMTSAVHSKHASTVDPTTLQTLEASTNRNSCYNCHPGSVTKCLRGAMGDAVDAYGNALMSCQSCHSSMSKVGDPKRVGWLQEPNCQACHFNGQRTTSAVDASGNLVKPADTRFATSPDTPAKGFSLFRFSKGHGGMQCEACHGSTHAEYPSSHVNDNLQSIALQGYAGTVVECTVCHSKPPLTATGGPHGLHTIGAAWVSAHGNIVESSGSASCAYCHGSTYRGGPLAKVKAPRTFSVEGRTKIYAAGQVVSCYDCHNGPKP